jgi:cysteinyl-tRNA synthetase
MLHKGFSPMSVRFFMLQAHYRSTLDFSNEALDAAEKGFKRLMSAVSLLDKLQVSDKPGDLDLEGIRTRSYAAMNDDFNSPVLIAELFELVRIINSAYDGKIQLSQSQLEEIRQLVQTFVFDVLGLKDEVAENDDFEQLMEAVIRLRNEAKNQKDYATSDRIRDELARIGIQLKDSKDQTRWSKR